jgi:hypothetical protein
VNGITSRFVLQVLALVTGVGVVTTASLFFNTLWAALGGLLVGLVVAGTVAALAASQAAAG